MAKKHPGEYLVECGCPEGHYEEVKNVKNIYAIGTGCRCALVNPRRKDRVKNLRGKWGIMIRKSRD